MIDPSIGNINRWFVFTYNNGNNSLTRNYFDEHYISPLEVKDFNAIFDNQPFFDQPMKTKQEPYKKLQF